MSVKARRTTDVGPGQASAWEDRGARAGIPSERRLYAASGINDYLPSEAAAARWVRFRAIFT